VILTACTSRLNSFQSARELTAAILCHELAAALKQVNLIIEQGDDEDELGMPGSRAESKHVAFGKKLKDALREVWKDPGTDVFDIGYAFTCCLLVFNTESTSKISRRGGLHRQIG